MLSFTLGALLPLLTITLTPAGVRIWVTVAAVVVALALTGWASARLGYGAPAAPSSATSAGACSRWRSPTRSAPLLGTQIG